MATGAAASAREEAIATAQTVVKTEDIESKKKMGTSIMPSALTLGISEQELADLSTYLLHLKK